MKILGVIPARYDSVRFPGKPLAMIKGKPMIQWVYEGSQKASCLSELVVATDDNRIKEAVEDFGGHVVMTSPDHPNGTSRCHEVLEKLEESFDAIINIQGDEPLINEEPIQQLADLLTQPDVNIGTLVKTSQNLELLNQPSVVKVVMDVHGRALYFSRAPIPKPNDEVFFHQHVGIYGFNVKTIRELVELPIGMLERMESLEQLRWLEAGYQIHCQTTTYELKGVDLPEDVQRIEALLVG